MDYFFLFSDGSYSDYSVGGLYKTDRRVTQKMWDKFLNKQVESRNKKMNEFKRKACTRVGITDEDEINMINFYGSPEWREWDDWRRKQESDDTVFQKLHNMVEIEYEELHGGM